MKLHSYVVRYDSGFAPNPFYEYCTLATCKPKIRGGASAGDWLLGSGSADQSIGRGGYLVYAMRVTETLSFTQYDADPRFQRKRPYRYGSRMQSCGDNIYYKTDTYGPWQQRDSFHSNDNGTPSANHISKDTATNRVLVSDDYVYFGGYGPQIPMSIIDSKGIHICHSGIGHKSIDELPVIQAFESWIKSLGVRGYQSAPYEWKALRGT